MRASALSSAVAAPAACGAAAEGEDAGDAVDGEGASGACGFEEPPWSPERNMKSAAPTASATAAAPPISTLGNRLPPPPVSDGAVERSPSRATRALTSSYAAPNAPMIRL